MADRDLRTLDYATWIRELEQDPRKLVTVERPSPDRAIVRLNDPGNHNALSGPLTVQLRRALLDRVEDLDLRSIVLTGEGDDFSVGGDWELTIRSHQRNAAGRSFARGNGFPSTWSR